ncbi:hypothetical protein [Clostridium nigeriense]|uniref:hypothetical protein n=1 Tax=Clostridium nigeriense TaxID=1805470 RepID=UPI0008326C24|nr:hypothetical protein [Clostridium nigeriense]
MDLEYSLEIIEEAINDYFEERTYSRYILDNLLLQFNGTPMDYMEYKKELGYSNRNNITKNKEINKEKIRNDVEEILSSIFG